MSNGFIYVMTDSSKSVKVGISKTPDLRLKQLKTGNSTISMVFTSKEVGNSKTIESAVHAALSNHSIGGEWFSCDKHHAIRAIEGEINRIGKPTTEMRIDKGSVLASFKIDRWKQLGCSLESASMRNYDIVKEYLNIDKTDAFAKLSHEEQYMVAVTYFARAYLISFGF